MSIASPVVLPTPPRLAELDRLGDEIAELSAHLDAATARLLALIREFDVRGGSPVRVRPALAGSGSASMWVGRSTSCILG